MYEHKKQPLASNAVYQKRLLINIFFTIGVLIICLSIGVAGYHYSANIGWLDSLHNASMILSGMGPVVEIKTTSGKLFSSFYALFSGVAFITNISLVLAPIAHRFFHKLHLEEK